MEKIRINCLGFLWLLGLIGILWLFVDNPWFYGFFGFFWFFGFLNHEKDERFKENIFKAWFVAFIFALVWVSFMVLAIWLNLDLFILASIVATTFVIILFAFLLSFYYFEKKG